MPSECWPLQEELKGNRDIPPTILELCQELHMFNTGSCDTLGCDKITMIKTILVLEMAVKYWREEKGCWKEYDDAVLNVVKVVLKEYYERDKVVN